MNIRRCVPVFSCTVHGGIERVDGLIGIIDLRVGVEHLAEDGRSSSLVGKDDDEFRLGFIEW